MNSGDSRMKKVGGNYGAKEKVGGQHKCLSQMSILHGDFSLLWRLSCYDKPYQTQRRLVNIVEYILAFLFSRDT